jgi:hypothetical protein
MKECRFRLLAPAAPDVINPDSAPGQFRQAAPHGPVQFDQFTKWRLASA